MPSTLIRSKLLLQGLLLAQLPMVLLLPTSVSAEGDAAVMDNALHAPGRRLSQSINDLLKAACLNPHRCWLKDYILFHNAQRGKMFAKYLVWTCFGPGPRGKDNIYENDCAGLGDRMRGIEYSLRLAYNLNRVLLVHQEVPAPMTTFFEPGAIDWRITDDLDIKLTPDIKHFVLQDGGNLSAIAKTSEAALEDGTIQGLQDRVVTLSTNYFFERYAGKKNTKFHYHVPGRKALVQALFKPSPAVQERVDRVLREMGIGGEEKFVAFHLRLGHTMGELQRQLRHSFQNATDIDIVNIAQQCAMRLAGQMQQNGGGGKPPRIVLVTDESDLRQRAIKGELAPWISPPVQPVHFSDLENGGPSSGEKVDVEKHLMSMVDFGIIYKAECTILTRSGFSQQARLMGPYTCSTSLDDCLTYNSKAGQQ